MKVFLSTSGERSRAVGIALREWLPLILQRVEPWLSTTDIGAGRRWADEVGQQLEHSSFGILCLTQENLSAAWVLFEAGALTKSVAAGSVVPYLLGIDIMEITGPLAQFQAKKSDELSTLEMVRSINERTDGPIPQNRLEQLYKAFWPALAGHLQAIPPADPSASLTRVQHQMLEDLVKSVREIEHRFRLTPSPFRTTRRLRDMPDWERRARGLLFLNQKHPALDVIRSKTGRSLADATELLEAWEEGG